jgi:hypothetical protein
MLITERTSDGRTIVRLHKDWHPGRISAGYLPPQRNYMETEEDFSVQCALLKSTSIINRNLTKIGATS